MRSPFQILRGLFARPEHLRGRRFKPSLELLEGRVTPTEFRWIIGAVGGWENAANWLPNPFVANAWPGWNGTAATTNDIAIIRGANSAPTMANAHELASIELTNTFTGTLRLEDNLRLNNGGTMVNGTIIQRPTGGTADGRITLIAGNFTWTGGDINYSTTVATTPSGITIEGLATLTVATTGGVVLGSDLMVQGVLNLSNTGTFNLQNRPIIENNYGLIDVTTDGRLTYEGDKIPITNSGIIAKTGGGTSYDIGMPLANQVGLILAQSGELRFSAAAPATGYSIDQTGGTIRLQGGSLRADFGVLQESGKIEAIGPGTGIIAGRVTVYGGDVYIGTATSPGTTLQISGNFSFQPGHQIGGIHYYYDTVAGVGGLLRALPGSISLHPDTTQISVTFLGAGPLPAGFRIMAASGGFQGTAQTFPEGYIDDWTHAGELWLRRL